LAKYINKRYFLDTQGEYISVLEKTSTPQHLQRNAWFIRN